MGFTYCTQPVLPRNEFLFLLDSLVLHAKQTGFNRSRPIQRRVSRLAVRDFNRKFEGKRVPGSSRPEMKKSEAELYCALRENAEELKVRLDKEIKIFRAEKTAAENREKDRVLGGRKRPAR